MLTHTQICTFVAASYNQAATWTAGDDIRAVGTQVGDEFVVAIPGTTDLQGWLDDFSIWPRVFPTIGTYHEGFGKWGLALAQLVLPAVGASGRLVIAGHSLGGALALVLAACSAARKRPPARVLTFGCPRGAFMGNMVAGPLVRSALEAVEYRNWGDPIPDVPPWPTWKHAVKGTMLGAPIHDLAGSMQDHAIQLYSAHLKGAGL
jgi:hypothetical protein